MNMMQLAGPLSLVLFMLFMLFCMLFRALSGLSSAFNEIYALKERVAALEGTQPDGNKSVQNTNAT